MIILSSNAKNRRLSLLAAIKITIEGTIYGGVLSVAELGRNIGNIAHKNITLNILTDYAAMFIYSVQFCSFIVKCIPILLANTL